MLQLQKKVYAPKGCNPQARQSVALLLAEYLSDLRSRAILWRLFLKTSLALLAGIKATSPEAA